MPKRSVRRLIENTDCGQQVTDRIPLAGGTDKKLEAYVFGELSSVLWEGDSTIRRRTLARSIQLRLPSQARSVEVPMKPPLNCHQGKETRNEVCRLALALGAGKGRRPAFWRPTREERSVTFNFPPPDVALLPPFPQFIPSRNKPAMVWVFSGQVTHYVASGSVITRHHRLPPI